MTTATTQRRPELAGQIVVVIGGSAGVRLRVACFVQRWAPWGVGRVPQPFPKVKPVIDLGEEVR